MLKYFHRHERPDRAQSLLEFTVLLIIIMAVFLSMSSYVKRGMQGRWKSAIDDFSDQYDPQQTNSATTYSAITDASTNITTQGAVGGYYTTRTDSSNSTEFHNAYSQVGQDGAF